MSILNIVEMAALLGLNTDAVLNEVKGDVRGSLENALAVVDFSAASAADPESKGLIRVRRHHWQGAFGMKIPVPKDSNV